MKSKSLTPDLEWYAELSERRQLPCRCPHASLAGCPRYYDSAVVLAMAEITSPLPTSIVETIGATWNANELFQESAETSPSASGGVPANCFSKYCPEVAYDTFGVFADNVIFFFDSRDRSARQNLLVQEGANEDDWRWNFEHVSPMHFSRCPTFSKLTKFTPTMQINNFHGSIHGQVNVAGANVNAPVLDLTIQELIRKIDESPRTQSEKDEAKGMLSKILAHPIVSAIAGGLAGAVGDI